MNKRINPADFHPDLPMMEVNDTERRLISLYRMLDGRDKLQILSDANAAARAARRAQQNDAERVARRAR